MEFDSGSCTQKECSVNNQVRMITGHASMGRMLTSSQVALSGFCMRPVACDQADGNALSGEETQIHERKGLPSRGLLACHSLPSVVLITKVFFTEFQIYRVILMPNK